jgi:hypothetical protein
MGAATAPANGQTLRVREVRPGIPIGLVGRLVTGRDAGFYVEVDDDSERKGGTGGFYVLTWTAEVGYDDWYESADDLASAFSSYGPVEWLSEQESATVPGRHRHGEARS